MQLYQFLLYVLVITTLLIVSSCAQLNVKQGIYHYRVGNFVQALDILRPMAEKGNTEAQYYLGEMYVSSSVLPRDYNEAEIWWRKAATAGHNLAKTKMGLIRTMGYGIRKDLNSAETWFLGAARSGEPSAQYNLALLYEKSTPTPQWEKSLPWYEAAAKQNLRIAQIRLTQIYDRIDDVKNPEKAIHWLKEVTKKGAANETISFSSLLHYDKTLGFVHGTYSAEQSIRHYLHTSYVEAQLKLADYYLHGDGPVKKNPKKAFAYYSELARGGNLQAMTHLGDLFASGVGVKKDEEKAMKLYNEAARRKYAPALSKIAKVYEQGNESIPENSRQALQWYMTAAKSGNAEAQLHLGNIYEQGNEVGKDFITAYMWYNIAARSDNTVVANKAKARLETIVEQLTPTQLFEAERRIASQQP